MRNRVLPAVHHIDLRQVLHHLSNPVLESVGARFGRDVLAIITGGQIRMRVYGLVDHERIPLGTHDESQHVLRERSTQDISSDMSLHHIYLVY